ncbi:hypothetical protein KIPB_006105, partial [Kipferlia bialata]
ACVVYLPTMGQKRVDEFCECLKEFLFTATPLCSLKNPSSLKRVLSGTNKHFVVCTQEVLSARPGSKDHKLHACLWRELAKAGVAARVYMVKDEILPETQLDTYTRLEALVKTQYLAKLSSEAQESIITDPLVTLLPLDAYIEEV